MHVSSFKYEDEPMRETPSCSRSREVRVRYFDPRTGEPCESKPEPLRTQRERITNFEKDEKRIRDEEEAAEIMRNMKERKKAERQAKADSRKGSRGNRKPVIVDGVVFKTSEAAAREVGTTPAYISTVLNHGGGMCKGRMVAFAKEGR